MLPSPLEAAWEHHHQLHQLQGRLLGAGSSEQSIPSATASSAANASSSAAGRRLLPSPGPKKVNKRERCKVCTEHILELDMRAKGAWLSQFFEQPKKVRFSQMHNLGLRQLFLTVALDLRNQAAGRNGREWFPQLMGH